MTVKETEETTMQDESIEENTPETEEEETNDGISTEEEEDDEEESGTEEGWEEEDVEEMKQRLQELEENNSKLTEEKQKLYKKLKSWYKKGKNLKEKVESEYVSKDDVRELLNEIQSEEKEHIRLKDSYDDFEDLYPEAKKLKDEKGLDLEDAYLLVHWKVMKDEGYRNQILGKRAGNYGQMSKTSLSSKADAIFAKKPKILDRN